MYSIKPGLFTAFLLHLNRQPKIAEGSGKFPILKTEVNTDREEGNWRKPNIAGSRTNINLKEKKRYCVSDAKISFYFFFFLKEEMSREADRAR